MTMPAGPTMRAWSGTPRWLKLLLVASLALNLLVVGATAGSFWMFRHGGAWGGNLGGSLIGYASELPAERRREIWRLTAEQRRELRPHWREVGRLRREAMAAIRAEPFDAERFAAAQARLHEAETKARAASQPLVTAVLKGLTREERSAMITARQRVREERGHGGRSWLNDDLEEGSKGAAGGAPASDALPRK